MRFVSQYICGEELTCRPEIVEHYVSGESRVTQEKLVVGPWNQGDITQWEREVALEHWDGKIRGLAEGENPLRRMSGFDSELAQQQNGWTDEERELVEQTLLNNQYLGTRFIMVPRPTAPPPYALYDEHRKIHGRRTLEHVLTDIRNAYDATGFDVNQAVIYERENLNDAAVIAFLEALAPAPVAGEQVIVA